MQHTFCWHHVWKKQELKLLVDVDNVSEMECVMPYIGMQSQQQEHEWLCPKQRIFISQVLGCEQSLWTSNATKFAREWFQIEK